MWPFMAFYLSNNSYKVEVYRVSEVRARDEGCNKLNTQPSSSVTSTIQGLRSHCPVQMWAYITLQYAWGSMYIVHYCIKACTLYDRIYLNVK